jgi:hypothetical protein
LAIRGLVKTAGLGRGKLGVQVVERVQRAAEQKECSLHAFARRRERVLGSNLNFRELHGSASRSSSPLSLPHAPARQLSETDGISALSHTAEEDKPEGILIDGR